MREHQETVAAEIFREECSACSRSLPRLWRRGASLVAALLLVVPVQAATIEVTTSKGGTDEEDGLCSLAESHHTRQAMNLHRTRGKARG